MYESRFYRHCSFIISIFVTLTITTYGFCEEPTFSFGAYYQSQSATNGLSVGGKYDISKTFSIGGEVAFTSDIDPAFAVSIKQLIIPFSYNLIEFKEYGFKIFLTAFAGLINYNGQYDPVWAGENNDEKYELGSTKKYSETGLAFGAGFGNSIRFFNTRFQIFDRLDLINDTIDKAPIDKYRDKDFSWRFICGIEMLFGIDNETINNDTITLLESDSDNDETNETEEKPKISQQSPLGQLCKYGMQKSKDTYGNCCWPGQVWNGKECIGEPSCPSSAIATKTECICPDGKIFVPGNECCWPEQGWSMEKQICIGRPRCPMGMILSNSNEIDCMKEQVETKSTSNVLQTTAPTNLTSSTQTVETVEQQWPGTPQNPKLRIGEQWKKALISNECSELKLMLQDRSYYSIPNDTWVVSTTQINNSFMYILIPSYSIHGWINEKCIK